MYPILIRTIEESKKIKSALDEFYFRRPDDYGLKREGENVYTSYIDLVARYTKKGGRVLDLGSGAGYAVRGIYKKGFKVIGCDLLSEEKLKEYKALLDPPKVDLISYDGSKLPFKAESFDTISSLCVFEHIVFPDKMLNEIDRVLRKNGILIIQCPNWSGLNIPIRAIQSLIFKKDRYWQYQSIRDAFCGIFRSLFWYFRVFCAHYDRLFLIIYPRIKNGKIDFERSDDDCVHLCQPLSFKKWFKKNNYKILEYNRFRGASLFAKLFNSFFPSFATTNTLIAKKY